MKFKYIEETDTFYLMLSDNKSVESEEIADDIVVDFDKNGSMIGFEILSAKSKIDFSNLLFDSLPFKNVNIINQAISV
ncbi:MAG: DUF2283 domain-containing protein [bacterium]